MKLKAQQGMTMLELMVAVMMLAVFMAGFVGITEFTSAITQGVAQDQSNGKKFTASDLAIARSLADDRLNQLAKELANAPFPEINNYLGEKNCLPISNSWIDGNWRLKNQQLLKIPRNQRAFVDPKWDVDEGNGFIDQVCLYTIDPESSNQPGLYVIQAMPIKAGPLMQPLRVLFCRPKKYCLS